MTCQSNGNQGDYPANVDLKQGVPQFLTIYSFECKIQEYSSKDETDGRSKNSLWGGGHEEGQLLAKINDFGA